MRHCFVCRDAEASLVRWIDHASRQLCVGCAAALEVVRQERRDRGAEKPPPKPPCLLGYAHHWVLTPGDAPTGVCLNCLSAYRFPPPSPDVWTSLPARVEHEPIVEAIAH